MRVTLWSTGYYRGFGGSEQMVNALLRSFHRQGLETDLIADARPGGKPNNSFFSALPEGIEIYTDCFANPLLSGDHAMSVVGKVLRYARAAVNLRKFLLRRAPDIIHIHLVTVDVFLLIIYKFVFNYRLVITFRGGDLSAIRRSRLACWKVRAALRFADGVTTVSHEMLGLLSESFRHGNAVCIHNGVDQRELLGAAQRESLIPAGHFIYAGRLHPDKRVPLLAELFGAGIRAGVRESLYIIGDGEERQRVAEYIRRNGFENRIFLLGAFERQKVLAALARARCLLLASAEEGCPNVVLEAMGLGVPVIAPATGGVPELVRHGETGYLFPPEDPEMAVKYVLLLSYDKNKAREMGQHGRNRVRTYFDLTDTAARYIQLYQNLLASRRDGTNSAAQKPADV